MRTLLILSLVLAGCSDSSSNTTPPVDAPPPDTANTDKLDCPTYCAKIEANCTGANVQFVDDAHCMATCMKFTPGALADTAGNTLGCRIYHANNAKSTAMPDVHCPHAGPGGAPVDNAATAANVCGDACTSFCSLEIAACGIKGTDATGQYTSMGDCMTACGGMNTGFNKTHLYTYDLSKTPNVTPAGDSLACRLYHVTNAAQGGANATTHCPHTSVAGGPNVATCMAGTTPTP